MASTEAPASTDTYKFAALTGKNYSSWRVQITSVLKSKNLFKYCIDPHPEGDDLTKMKNENAKTLMLTSMSAEICSSFACCVTAFEMWKAIEEAYQGTTINYKNKLLKDLFDMKLENEDVEKFITRFLDKSGQLAIIGCSVPEDTKVCLFMKGLAKTSHYNIANMWRISNPNGNLHGLVSVMRMNQDEAPEKSVALVSQQKPKPSTSAKPKTNKKDLACNHCGKKGHLWRECRTRLAGKEVAKTNEKKFQPEPKLKFTGAFMATTGDLEGQFGPYDWVMDSGATSHMTPNIDLLDDVELFETPTEIGTADRTNKGLIAAGKGNFYFQDRYLQDVLWVPNLPCNLFSVQAVYEKGFRVDFDPEIGEIRVLKQGIVLLSGSKKGTYSVLTLSPTKKSKSQTVLMAGSELDWHERFGHVGLRAIKDLNRHNAVIGLSIKPKEELRCEACAYGKVCRVSHPASTRMKLKGIVHFDTVGPISPQSLGGNRYFILATEERSGYKIINFASSKESIWQIVHQVVNDVTSDLREQVKAIVTDQGTEYLNQNVDNWLRMMSIKHYCSTAYVHQQNGMAERSNRTIIEGATTLLHSANLPLNLWPEACNTIVYTSNRTINYRWTEGKKTKFELYFGHPPHVGNLRKFGAHAVLLEPKKASKFAAKGKTWRFVGYTERYNTFRFYDEANKVVKTACDVFFIQQNRQTNVIVEQPETASISREEATQITAAGHLTPTFMLTPSSHEDESAHNLDETLMNTEEQNHILNLKHLQPTLAREGIQCHILEHAQQAIADNEQPMDSSALERQSPRAIESTATQTEQNNEALADRDEIAAVDNAPDNLMIRSCAQQLTLMNSQDRQLTSSESAIIDSTEELQALQPYENLALENNRGSEQIIELAPSPKLKVIEHGRGQKKIISTPREVGNLKIAVNNPPEVILDNGHYTRGLKRRNAEQGRAEKFKGICLEQALLTLNGEPSSLKEAKERTDWELWRQAMEAELEAIINLNVFELVDLPTGAKLVKCMWVFKLKTDKDGNVTHKARLVAKGYSQIPDVDYKETFAPVASISTVRLILATAVQRGMTVIQLDVATAFLNGDLDETIYMAPPEGTDSSGKVLLLKKSLYGLKQSPRQWNIKFHQFLIDFKLIQDATEPCLYFNEERSLIVGIYVDDGIVAASDMALAQQLIDYLKTKCKIKSAMCNHYLGIEINFNETGDKVTLKQSNYIQRTLERFQMENCNAAQTPEATAQPTGDEPLGENIPFKQAIGCLIFLATCTRPDIAHAVSTASRTDAPKEKNWQMVKRILRYLKGTINVGISFQRQKIADLKIFVDADHANDTTSRKSTTGFVIKHAGGPIMWGCHLQTCVSMSSTEAESIAICDCAKKGIPIRNQALAIRAITDKPMKIYCDNQPAVNMTKSEKSSQRTKYMDVRHKKSLELTREGIIDVQHLPGVLQQADILTKPLTVARFSYLRGLLMSICLLSILNSNADADLVPAAIFRPTSPVYYKPSDVQIFVGARTWDLKVTVLNPCKIWFTEVTLDAKINRRLVEDCEDSFREKVKINKFCQRYADHKTTVELEFMHFGRKKRSPIALVGAGGYALGLGVVAANSAFNSYKINLLSEDIQALIKTNNDKNVLLEQGLEQLKLQRDVSVDIGNRVDGIERRLNFINATIREFPRIASLVARYERIFERYNTHLKDINLKALERKMSAQILELTNYTYWNEPGSEWSRLHKCAASYNNLTGDFESNFWFTMPTSVKEARVVESRYIKFWNRTESNQLCRFKYIGPKYVMINESNHCYLELNEHWIEDRVVKGKFCAEEGGKVKILGPLFIAEECPETPDFDSTIAAEQFEDSNLVYCWNRTIEIRGKVYECPETVGKLSLADSFKLTGYNYENRGEVEVMVKPLIKKMNTDLQAQLDLENLKIRTTNFTKLDSGMERYEKILRQVAMNLTHLELPAFMESPFNSLAELFSSTWTWLKVLFFGLCVFGLIVLLTITAPIFHIVFLITALAGRAVNKGIQAICRHTLQVLPTHQPPRKTNWD